MTDGILLREIAQDFAGCVCVDGAVFDPEESLSESSDEPSPLCCRVSRSSSLFSSTLIPALRSLSA